MGVVDDHIEGRPCLHKIHAAGDFRRLRQRFADRFGIDAFEQRRSCGRRRVHSHKIADDGRKDSDVSVLPADRKFRSLKGQIEILRLKIGFRRESRRNRPAAVRSEARRTDVCRVRRRY